MSAADSESIAGGDSIDAFLPALLIPATNPLTSDKVTLGKRLFSETALSTTGRYSCASCHDPAQHFTDGRPVAIGATGQRHTRNTPTLYNVGYNASFGWEDLGLEDLEAQHYVPLFNTAPVEMGYTDDLLLRLIRGNEVQQEDYAAQFASAFPGEEITTAHLVAAIASYVRTIRAPVSAFDRYLFFDDKSNFDKDAEAGLILFFSARLGCANCHASFNFSGSVVHQQQQALPVFHVMGVSGSTVGIRAPTLRAVAHTGPYMHDGSITSLDEVIRHYENADSERVPEFTLTNDERLQLVAFLKTL